MISLTKRRATVCSVLCSQGEDVKQTITQRLTDAHDNRKIVAAFRGMHVSPAKHSFGKCDRKVWQTDRQTNGQTTDKVIPMCRYASQATQKEKCDRQTDRQTDDGQSDPYVSLCFTGDTIRSITISSLQCKNVVLKYFQYHANVNYT